MADGIADHSKNEANCGELEREVRQHAPQR